VLVFAASLLLAAPAEAPAAGPLPPSAAPSRVRAADALRILVVAPDVDGGERVEEIYAGLRAAGLLPVELEERAGVDLPAPPVAPPGVLDDARAALAEARARFRDLDLDGVRPPLDGAVDQVLRLERPEAGLEVLTDALLLRAHLSLQLGADEDAREALMLVSRLEPGREALHPGLHPPSLVAAYAEARAAALAAPEALLLVRPRVADFHPAEVVVDGRPARFPISAGPHLVTVRSPGAVPDSRILSLSPSEPLLLEPFLGPRDVVAARRAGVEAARTARDEPSLARALDEVSRLSAARVVLFVGRVGDEPRAALYVAGRGLEGLAVPASADGFELGRAALAALQPPARRAVGLPPRDDDGALWTSAAIVGGGALALAVIGVSIAVGAWALAPAAPPPLPPRPVVVSCCFD
jgi:hypothetical protein